MKKFDFSMYNHRCSKINRIYIIWKIKRNLKWNLFVMITKHIVSKKDLNTFEVSNQKFVLLIKLFFNSAAKLNFRDLF